MLLLDIRSAAVGRSMEGRRCLLTRRRELITRGSLGKASVKTSRRLGLCFDLLFFFGLRAPHPTRCSFPISVVNTWLLLRCHLG